MDLFAIIAVIAAIISGLFFIGALIWAVRSFFKSRDDATPTHVVLNQYQGGNSSSGTYNNYHPNNPETMPDPGFQSSQDYNIETEEQYSQSYDTIDEDLFVPQKGKGFVAASETSDISGQDFYKVTGYEFEADIHDIDEELKEKSDEKILPKVILTDGKMPTIEKRERPQKRVLPESTRCNICLGYIKTGLPLITCVCSKNYHISCASRVEQCPMCNHDMLDYEDNRPEEKALATEDMDNVIDDIFKGEIEEEITDETEKQEDGINILDKEQMARLKKLLERYDLNTDDSLK
ncbi:MAG: RING-H2 finger protein, partial [Candidatus Thermoplasmatota archaeon]|nr:RING-H2 finger protein [Candidatus Thermoplasmatota archaeon]